MTEAGPGKLSAVTLGFIGAGNMGRAIIRGLLAGGRVAKANVVFYDPDPRRQAELQNLGVRAAPDHAGVMPPRWLSWPSNPKLSLLSWTPSGNMPGPDSLLSPSPPG